MLLNQGKQSDVFEVHFAGHAMFDALHNYQSRSKSPRCFVQRNGQRGPVGTSYMIPIVYRYVDSYTALSLLLVYWIA